jgi:excisionase family DNA binding protein
MDTATVSRSAQARPQDSAGPASASEARPATLLVGGHARGQSEPAGGPTIGTVLPETIAVAEAAELAGVTGKTVRKWAEQLPDLAVKVGGRWRIRRHNLMFILRHGTARYLEAQERRAAERKSRDGAA